MSKPNSQPNSQPNSDFQRHDFQLGFIGGGNMASAIICGLLGSGFSARQIHVADPSSQRREFLALEYQIQCYSSNAECAEVSDVLVLSVKPQMLQQALRSISTQLADTNPLIISIAAAIRIADIKKWARGKLLEEKLSVIRVMPNTPALVNSGVSALYADSGVTEGQKSHAQSIMQAVGAVVWLNSENDIDTITGISGSGPAYYFRLMELMMEKAISCGINEAAARTLVLNTALGAAKLAMASEDSPAQLRKNVTSHKGTTEAALNRMESLGFAEAIHSGIAAAIARSEVLAKELGDS